MTRHASAPKSLAARIDDAERHLLEHRRSVDAHGTMLSHRIHQRLSSPAVLGSAVGVGFLLGNRTRSPGSGHSWLRLAVSSMPWMQSLFTSVNPGAPTRVASSSEFPD